MNFETWAPRQSSSPDTSAQSSLRNWLLQTAVICDRRSRIPARVELLPSFRAGLQAVALAGGNSGSQWAAAPVAKVTGEPYLATSS